MKKTTLFLAGCFLLAACNLGTTPAPAVTEPASPSGITPATETASPDGVLPTTGPATDTPAPVEPAYSVVLRDNPQNAANTDVYLRDDATAEEHFFLTVADVYRSHYHPAEYAGGYLLIIRRIGNPATDSNWTDELWRYDAQGSGLNLFTQRGLDFRAAPNGEPIAVDFLDGEINGLAFIDVNGFTLHAFQVDGPAGNDMLGNSPVGWSSDGSVFWGALEAGPVPNYFYSISAGVWQMTTYDVTQLPLGSDFALNADTGKLAYSDYPVFFDADSAQTFANSGQLVMLYLYDLFSQNQETIATSSAKAFEPAWVDDKTLAYDDPNGSSRVNFILP